jgi:anti-anti-sigma factor
MGPLDSHKEERNMEIKITTENVRVPVTVMHVDGNIDSSSFEAFQAKADELIKGGARYILVDLAHAPFVSSAGLRVLNNIFNQLRALQPDADLSKEDMSKGIRAGTYKSPHLKLLNLSDTTRISFNTAGFDMYIETFKDLKKALASF